LHIVQIMHVGQQTVLSLRERRKLETSALIQRAALELARDHGVEGVTIEAICEAAGVSQRTFHNYFPFKEAVFVVAPEPLPPAAVEKFLSAPGDLMADVTDLMVAHAAELQKKRWLTTLVLRDVARLHPRLIPLQMAEFFKFDRQIKEVLAVRLGFAADHPSCSALAGAVLGANRATVDRWLEDPDLYLPDAIRAGLDAMTSLVRQPKIASPGDPATGPSG
jgi:AcrR family transcriptional regulator